MVDRGKASPIEGEPRLEEGTHESPRSSYLPGSERLRESSVIACVSRRTYSGDSPMRSKSSSRTRFTPARVSTFATSQEPRHGERRVRVGQYRATYEIVDGKVVILEIGSRGNFY